FLHTTSPNKTYTLSLHDALPIYERPQETPMFKSIAVRVSQGTQYIPDPRKADPVGFRGKPVIGAGDCAAGCDACVASCPTAAIRSEEHTSELQSRGQLVCRLLLE